MHSLRFLVFAGALVFLAACNTSSNLEDVTCTETFDCRYGEICYRGVCVEADSVVIVPDASEDTSNGSDVGGEDTAPVSCGTETCSGNEICCEEGDTPTCVSQNGDSLACGTPCGPVCETGEVCDESTGACVCAPGTADCDGDNTALCETSTNDDADNCGACGVSCREGERCVGGECTCGSDQCTVDEVCCDTESDVACINVYVDDTLNCGACGQVCGEGEVCAQGECKCGETASSNGSACGGGRLCCREKCVSSIDDPACKCDEGFADCDSNGSCESDLTAPTTCGACGVACGDGAICVDGACFCDNATTGESCFAKGFNHTAASCSGEDCTVTCSVNSETGEQTHDDCNGEADDGCEAQLGTDDTCLSCSDACAAGQTCGETGCVCPAGFDDCDGNDTCETDLGLEANCGACGAICGDGATCKDGTCVCVQGAIDGDTDCFATGTAHTAAACTGLTCNLTCTDTTVADCDNDPSTSCETSLGTDSDCTACSDTCTSGESCGTNGCE